MLNFSSSVQLDISLVGFTHSQGIELNMRLMFQKENALPLIHGAKQSK